MALLQMTQWKITLALHEGNSKKYENPNVRVSIYCDLQGACSKIIITRNVTKRIIARTRCY